MNTKLMKIATVIATILMLVLVGSNVVYGLTPTDLKANTSATGTTEIQNFGGNIMGVINVVGVVVAVVVLMVIGIKYMMGSAEEKAEYKKTMIPYIVGALLIFAGTSLVRVIYSLSTSVAGTGNAK